MDETKQNETKRKREEAKSSHSVVAACSLISLRFTFASSFSIGFDRTIFTSQHTLTLNKNGNFIMK
jgi:hypothetical protein